LQTFVLNHGFLSAILSVKSSIKLCIDPVYKSKTELAKIGYARVSTDDQNLDLQRDALGNAGCGEIYQEKASGKNAERAELTHCLQRAARRGHPSRLAS
jgi:predicted site-specific integrase-resolvase